MLNFAQNFLAVLIGFASGMFVSGAVFAFITVIGVVPRFAQKTRTQKHCRFYETALSLGGIFGTVAGFITLKTHAGLGAIGIIISIIFSFCVGIFYGCLAMSLAEVLDVIPIMTRRGRVGRGIFFFVLSIAIGKTVGALLYFFIPGFYHAAGM